MMNDDEWNERSWGTGSDVEDSTTINQTTTVMDKTAPRGDAPTLAEVAVQVAVGCVLSTLCLITVLGNMLVIHAVRTDRKLQTVGIAHSIKYCTLYEYYGYRIPEREQRYFVHNFNKTGYTYGDNCVVAAILIGNYLQYV